MFGKHRKQGAVVSAGAVLLAAHAILGAAGVMTVAQWSSGAAIGLVVLLAGLFWLMHAR
jgi:hypothetical protein